ncbi:hypothetical protein Tco_0675100 [Tanacetum coccineum]
MNRSLFTRIVRDLSANCPYFQEGCDAVGKAGISALVKCTSAIRQLAYAAVPDSLDEYGLSSKFFHDSAIDGRSSRFLSKHRYATFENTCLTKTDEYHRSFAEQTFHKEPRTTLLRRNKCRIRLSSTLSRNSLGDNTPVPAAVEKRKVSWRLAGPSFERPKSAILAFQLLSKSMLAL